MNQNQALAALKKLLGSTAAVRFDHDAPKAEERAAVAAMLPGLRDTARAAREAVEARRRSLLQDREYLCLVKEARSAGQALEAAAGRACWYPVTMGTVGRLFFEVRAQADTYAEGIRIIQEKKA